jgi:chromosome partitioning protein
MIVAVVSQKGGVGKSTLAAAIGWELLSRGSRVLIFDSDPQGTVRLAGEVAAEQGRAAPTIISLGKDMYRADQLPRLAEPFDHVIIDTPGRLGDVQRAALMVAHLALVPVGQSAADTWGATETLEVVKQAQVLRPDLRAALVITRKLPRTTLGRHARDHLGGAELPVLTTETTYRIAWQESLAAGLGTAQYAPRDAAAIETRALVDELLALVGATATDHRKEVTHG